VSSKPAAAHSGDNKICVERPDEAYGQKKKGQERHGADLSGHKNQQQKVNGDLKE